MRWGYTGSDGEKNSVTVTEQLLPGYGVAIHRTCIEFEFGGAQLQLALRLPTRLPAQKAGGLAGFGRLVQGFGDTKFVY